MMKLGSIGALDALKIAIQSETDMQQFYNDVGSYFEIDEIEAVLKGIANKEAQHRKRLIKEYSRLSGRKILYLNLNKKRKLNVLKNFESDPKEIVEIAKKNEKESRDFYLGISRRLYEPELRKFFRDLAMEEEQHIALIESTFAESFAMEEDENQENTSQVDAVAESG
jgi:rubrerythrin